MPKGFFLKKDSYLSDNACNGLYNKFKLRLKIRPTAKGPASESRLHPIPEAVSLTAAGRVTSYHNRFMSSTVQCVYLAHFYSVSFFGKEK
jgi:hypothetical protein